MTTGDKPAAATNNRRLRRPRGQVDTAGLKRKRRRKRRAADYLKKQAAGEEVGQLVTLTGDSYRDLRKDGRKDERQEDKKNPRPDGRLGQKQPRPSGGGHRARGHANKRRRNASTQTLAHRLAQCSLPPTHPLGRSVLVRILSWSLVLVQYQRPPRLRGG